MSIVFARYFFFTVTTGRGHGACGPRWPLELCRIGSPISDRSKGSGQTNDNHWFSRFGAARLPWAATRFGEGGAPGESSVFVHHCVLFFICVIIYFAHDVVFCARVSYLCVPGKGATLGNDPLLGSMAGEEHRWWNISNQHKKKHKPANVLRAISLIGIYGHRQRQWHYVYGQELVTFSFYWRYRSTGPKARYSPSVTHKGLL